MTLRTGRLAPVASHHHTILDLILIGLDHLEELVDAGFLLRPFVRGQTVPQPVLLLLGQIHIGFEDGKIIFGCMATEPFEPLLHLLTMPADHTTIVDGERRIGDDQLLVDTDDSSEALTHRTGACGGVEGEELVAGFLEHDTISLETGGEVVADVRRREHQTEFAMSLEEGRLRRVYQTCDGILRIVDAHTVDDQIDLSRLL